MEREIKFRGYNGDEKRGDWVYGDLIRFGKKLEYVAICPHEELAYDEYPVRKESVGQFTGLKDSTGREIFEGDIVHFKKYNQKHDDLDEGIAVVEFGTTVMNNQYTYGYCLDLSDCKQGKYKPSGFHRGLDHGSLKVLGNRWENPELLNN